MTANEASQIVRCLVAAKIPAWLDGGWGVDALLGRQTRLHDDLDLVIPQDAVIDATVMLAEHGFVIESDERPTRLVLRDANNRQVDVHPAILTADGGGMQALPGGAAFCYPALSFQGRGTLASEAVACMSAEAQMACHRGYVLTEKDRHDVRLMALHLGVAPPSESTKQAD